MMQTAVPRPAEIVVNMAAVISTDRTQPPPSLSLPCALVATRLALRRYSRPSARHPLDAGLLLSGRGSTRCGLRRQRLAHRLILHGSKQSRSRSYSSNADRSAERRILTHWLSGAEREATQRCPIVSSLVAASRRRHDPACGLTGWWWRRCSTIRRVGQVASIAMLDRLERSSEPPTAPIIDGGVHLPAAPACERRHAAIRIRLP